MKESDKKIIDDVDKWKQQEFDLRKKEINLRDQRERDASRLKHDRWMRAGRFIKWTLISVVSLALIFGSVFGIHVSCSAQNEERAAIEAEKAQRLEERSKQFDIDWAACVETLGIEQCKIIRDVSYERGYDDGYDRRKRDSQP